MARITLRRRDLSNKALMGRIISKNPRAGGTYNLNPFPGNPNQAGSNPGTSVGTQQGAFDYRSYVEQQRLARNRVNGAAGNLNGSTAGQLSGNVYSNQAQNAYGARYSAQASGSLNARGGRWNAGATGNNMGNAEWRAEQAMFATQSPFYDTDYKLQYVNGKLVKVLGENNVRYRRLLDQNMRGNYLFQAYTPLEEPLPPPGAPGWDGGGGGGGGGELYNPNLGLTNWRI